MKYISLFIIILAVSLLVSLSAPAYAEETKEAEQVKCICYYDDQLKQEFKKNIDKANKIILLRYASYAGKNHAHHNNCGEGGGEFTHTGNVCVCLVGDGFLGYWEHKCDACGHAWWSQQKYPR